MLKPEFLIKDQKGRNEKKEKKWKRRIPDRRSEESKKKKDRRKNRIIPDQYRKPGKRTEDLHAQNNINY